MDPPIAIPGVELLEELGHGGSSVVYRARRRGRPCAVKLARAPGKDSVWFRREAAALARVPDRGVPEVYEVGDVRGTAYLVMELVEGETLAARILRGRMSEAQVLEVGRGVARVLDAIHRRGLVHRDLSPRNIVLEEGGDVRIVDLGFATFAHSPRDSGATEAYAAPEQRRVPALVDARTDLYALGAILFECSSGTLPGRHPPQAVAEAHFSGPFATLLGGLLATASAERYASAGAVLSDIVRVQAGDPPAGREPARQDVPEDLPFVGRLGERGALLNAWGDAHIGRGHAAVVIGARGSGKSRLIREVMRAIYSAPCGAGTVYARCDDADPHPLAAVRTICDQLAERLAGLVPDVRGAAEQAIVRAAGGDLAPVLGALSPALAALGGVAGTGRADVNAETFSELSAELLARLSRELGVLAIFVDDAQWLQPASAEVIARLASRAAQEPLLLVLAARADPLGNQSEALPRDGLLRIDLGPFAGSAMLALVEAYLGCAPGSELLDWVASVSDGTPLGVVELLDTMLDAGGLAPRDGRWSFDRESTNRMHLPGAALELLSRRLGELPAAAQGVFQAAAIIGLSFEDALLAEVTGVDEVDLGFALAEARRARLIEAQSKNRHRFMHDSMREALLSSLDAERRRALHQATAEALDRSGSSDVYALARHYAAGQPGSRSTRAFETARAAAHKALEAFDSDAALRFFDAARTAAERAGSELDASLLTTAGESALRLGAHDQSIAHFESALARTSDPVERASLLGRIAWAKQAKPDADCAWATLARAFREIGEEMPTEKAGTMAQALLAFGRARLGRLDEEAGSARVLELLCQLHYQNARLGYEYDKPLRFVQSTIRGQIAATALGSGPAVARAGAFSGVVLCVAGCQRAGWDRIERARAEAARAGDPRGEAYCLQFSAVAACFSGDFDRASGLFGQVLDQHGPWLDMHDYCWDVQTAHLIEVLRGRPREAWRWLERAIDRAAPHGRAPGAFLVLAHCARATLAALDRSGRDEMRRALRIPLALDVPLNGLVRTGCWGSRARYLVETGAIGDELDALVAEFQAEGIQPRRAHPILVEYYVAVAEAHVLRCLRAGAADRPRRVAELRQAVRDLAGVARYPLYRAHLRLMEGFLAWFEGSARRARKKLAQAEELADGTNCPAVLFGVARAHAHILKSQGSLEASRERARMALAIARDQGAVQRARWILDELGGSWATADAARRSSVARVSSSNRRQLRALLRLLRVCNGELGDIAQAGLLVDELLDSVSADRALLAFEPDAHENGVQVSRQRGGQDWTATRDAHALIDEARNSAEPRARDVPGASGDVARAVAVPLFLNDAVVGAVYLERAETPLADAEMDILLALSYQVPIALELARALAEREALERSLRRVQKMEAVGRFAGGIAHDFNNMLTAMENSLSLAMTDVALGAESRSDLATVQAAVRRASDLTRQLLKFARRQIPTSDTYDLNEVLEQVAPMLQRLLGTRVQVSLESVATRAHAKVDCSMFEQAIVNLALNARDAMPNGGHLEIKTENVTFDENSTEPPRGLARGTYVLVTMIDSGTGMPADVRDSAFEPFFTTKAVGKGTGLGLSIVYGFVQQSDGMVELDSEPGRGTTFRMYFPRSKDRPAPARATARDAPVSAPRRVRTETVLLVEDEDLARKSLRRILERAGYHVLAAPDAETALQLAQQHTAEIHVMVSDVLLPGMLGNELAKQIRQISPRMKVLLMSGYTDGKLEGSLEDMPAAFLTKPFTPNDLDSAIRNLLEGAERRQREGAV